ncbi:hypothetical protein V8F33_013341 [Rhypophila sp. PSN 637]
MPPLSLNLSQLRYCLTLFFCIRYTMGHGPWHTDSSVAPHDLTLRERYARAPVRTLGQLDPCHTTGSCTTDLLSQLPSPMRRLNSLRMLLALAP